MDKTYKIKIDCGNCKYSGYREIPKGQHIGESKINECPICGCETLEESPNI